MDDEIKQYEADAQSSRDQVKKFRAQIESHRKELAKKSSNETQRRALEQIGENEAKLGWFFLCSRLWGALIV